MAIFHSNFKACCAFLWVCSVIWGQGTGGFDRRRSVKAISEVRVSPDGGTVLFSVDKSLMQIPARGGRPSAVLGAVEGASEIRWAPDGKRIAYIAKEAIWVQSLSGPAKKVCAYDRSNSFLSKAASMLAWSPDGKMLAFAGTVEPKPAAQDPVVIDRIQYKTRTALSDNRRAHIFVVSASGGTPKAVTSGKYDEHSIDWGGDGSEIIFLSNREPDPDAKLNYDIFAVNVASGQIRQITRTPGVEEQPVVSPDGKSIAYIATKGEITTIDSVAEDTHLWTVPVAGGEPREVNAALDRRTTAPEWSKDSSGVYYLAGDHGKTLIYKDNRPVFDKRAQISAYAVASNGVFYVMSDPTHPPELFSLDGQMTHVNDAVGGKFSVPEVVTFSSFDGTEVEGFYYPPLAVQGKVPMILSIHGGPHGQFGYAFNLAFQTNAARGYATLAINPRGSSGYGQKFSNGTLNNWGGGDFKDLMLGVDQVLKSHPEIDPERLGVTGGSYGGYMTNWVITQTTRFKAAVAVASVSDLVSFYATSLYQDLIHAEFGGFPWADGNYALLWKWSPLAHVKNVTTPTLFLHGELDNDVHITQAEEMYTALRQRGIEAEFVRYPREGHGFREVKHQADARERTLDWMDRFLKK